jgi:hypothetical protein
MAELMTRAEVIATAFDRVIEPTKIAPGMIEAVQLNHIMPIIGEDFYDALVETPSSYAAILEFIKPVLAYFVKFYALPRLYVEMGTMGLSMISGNNRQPVDQNSYEKMRAEALEMANLHAGRLNKFLYDNEVDYPLYFEGKNPARHVKVAGGIIFPVDHPDDDDDYTMHLTGY